MSEILEEEKWLRQERSGTIIPAKRLYFSFLDLELYLPVGDTETLSPSQLQSRLLSSGREREQTAHLSHIFPSFRRSHLPHSLFVFIMFSPSERRHTHLTTTTSSPFTFLSSDGHFFLTLHSFFSYLSLSLSRRQLLMVLLWRQCFQFVASFNTNVTKF